MTCSTSASANADRASSSPGGYEQLDIGHPQLLLGVLDDGAQPPEQ